MGLLEMPPMDSPAGQGLLAAAFSLMRAQKYPGQKRALSGALGDAGQVYLTANNLSQDQSQRRKYMDAQMQAQNMQLEEARRAQADRQRQEAAIQAQFTPGRPFNPMELLQSGGVGALEQGMRINGALNPQTKYETLAPGSSLVRMGDGGPETAFTAPSLPKDKATPAAIQEYEYAQSQGYKGSFEQWDTARKRAGATNIGMPKIDIKMGDSVAGQIGPMAKDSRVAVQGAVKMYDAAERIDKALTSNKVSAGPMSTQIQTVKQLVQKVAGGSDENIRQTQQVIRSLAQMAVEARKQLQGQGQVTESEAKAVAKADAGDIDSMTTGELQDLVTLTKRASHFIAKGHQEILDTMGANDGTRGAVPFYRVPGMDMLLKHQPKLPQIGGNSGWAIQKE